MSKLIYLPLEHIPSRYTVHMDRDITEYLEDSGKDFIKIYPDIPTPKSMKAGSFLDFFTDFITGNLLIKCFFLYLLFITFFIIFYLYIGVTFKSNLKIGSALFSFIYSEYIFILS